MKQIVRENVDFNLTSESDEYDEEEFQTIDKYKKLIEE